MWFKILFNFCFLGKVQACSCISSSMFPLLEEGQIDFFPRSQLPTNKTQYRDGKYHFDLSLENNTISSILHHHGGVCHYSWR